LVRRFVPSSRRGDTAGISQPVVRRTHVIAGTGIAARGDCWNCALDPRSCPRVNDGRALDHRRSGNHHDDGRRADSWDARRFAITCRTIRVIARLPNGRRILTVRAKHLGAIEASRAGPRRTGVTDVAARLRMERGDWDRRDSCDGLCSSPARIASVAAPSRVQDAVQQIEDAGDASGFLTEASTRNGWRGGKVFSLLNHYRGLGAMNLSPTERLALEMSVHEETETARDGGGSWRCWKPRGATRRSSPRSADDELTPPKLYE
jgi:hypothetical protein